MPEQISWLGMGIRAKMALFGMSFCVCINENINTGGNRDELIPISNYPGII